MKLSLYLVVCFVVLGLTSLPNYAAAQIVVLDDLIVMTSRLHKQSEARRFRHLEPPGGENLLPPSPGGDEPRLGEARSVSLPGPFSLLGRKKSRLRHGKGFRLKAGEEQTPAGITIDLVGPLEAPVKEETTAGALSLDAAVERLLGGNTDLAAKFQDIPKARADVLTAGLRNNPLLFVSFNNIPYGHFSPQRPTATSYDLTLIQPLDINGKRGYRIRAAQEALNVLEAQYQDAIRLKVDRLCDAFVDVMEARQALRAQQAGLARLRALEKTVRGLVERGLRPAEELDAVSVELVNAEAAIPRAETTLLQAQRELARLLGIPAGQAWLLETSDSLHDRALPPPSMKELIQIALPTRPDLTVYRLGLRRARADLGRENAEAVDDIFIFYTPFNADFRGEKVVTFGYLLSR